MDVYRAIESISACESVLDSYRNDDSFRSIYDKVQTVLGEDTVIKPPQVCGKQTKMANSPS